MSRNKERKSKDATDSHSDDLCEASTSQSLPTLEKNKMTSKKSTKKPCVQPTSAEESLPTIKKNKLTDLEKERAMERAVQTMYRKYFVSQKMFKLASVFSGEDKLTPKQQAEVMPLAIAKLERETKMTILTDGTRYIITLPQGPRENFLPDLEDMDTDQTSSEMERFPAPPELGSVKLTIALAWIYFYRGKIGLDDLMFQLQRFLPFLLKNGSDFTKLELTRDLNDFESRGFIVKKSTKERNEEIPKIYVYWGFRAKIECDKQNLIPIYCMMFQRDKSDLPISLLDRINKNENFYNDIYDKN